MQQARSRLDELTALSSATYDAACEQDALGVERSQRIARMGIHIVAQTLESGYGNGLVAGDYLQSYVFSTLNIWPALERWPILMDSLRELPRARDPRALPVDPHLDKLAQRFVTTTRKTVNRDGTFESDATHAIHMTVLAVAHAATHYPDLDRSKIALYCQVHDLPEGYAGDVSSLGLPKEGEAIKTADERTAIEQIRKEFFSIYPKLVRLIDAYKEREDDESCYTKSIDKLDPKFNSLYTNGQSLTGYHNLSAREYSDLVSKEEEVMRSTYARDFPDFADMHSVLTRQIIENTQWVKTD